MSFLPPSLSPLFTFLFPFSPRNVEYSAGATIMDKSLGTRFHFWGVIQFTPVQPLPSPHKQCWTCVSGIFSDFQLCIGWGGGGGGELQECTVLRGNQEMTEKYEYGSTVPRTFVQDCSYNVAPLAGFSQSKKRVLYPQRPFLLSMMSFLSERSCDSQSEVRFQKESNSW